MKKSRVLLVQFTFTLVFLFGSSAFAEVLSFGVIGDAGKWNDYAKSVRDSILGYKVTNLILPGDNLYDGSDYAGVWDHWLKRGLNLDIVALGNHNAGYRNEIAYFKMPGENYSRVTQNRNARFIVLNSDNVSNVLDQAKWFEAILAEAQEPFVFIIFHHPPFTLTPSHPWEEKKEFHEAIWPLLVKYRSKLSALLVGHDHIASFLTLDTLPVVVSGAVHEMREPLSVNYVGRNGVRVTTRWIYDQTPQWVKLDLDFDQNAWTAHFIKASDSKIQCSITMSAKSNRALMAPSCEQRRWR